MCLKVVSRRVAKAKIGGDGKDTWQARSWNGTTIYGSTYWWKFWFRWGLAVPHRVCLPD
jgi:hypothetical protein